MLEPKLQAIVEHLCNEGCQQVNVYIRDIEDGKLPEAMLELLQDERQSVLKELKSIMSVYVRCDV